MIRPVTFAADVQLTRENGYCICYQTTTHIRVMISLRLKEIIERGDWSHILPEDLEEIRSLRELGLVVEKPFSGY